MKFRQGAALGAGLLLLAAGCASGVGAGSPARPPSQRVTTEPAASALGPVAAVPGEPTCTMSTQPAPQLPATATAMLNLRYATSSGPVVPFGVAVTADGRWAFAALGGSVAVLRLAAGQAPRLVRMIGLPERGLGAALTPDGRYLLIAGGSGAVVVSVRAAEQGSAHSVLGELSASAGPRSATAIEVAVSADGRYAFVSLEYADKIAVFDLAKAEGDDYGAGAYVGAIPAGISAVGLAASPDGRWLYATSEGQPPASEIGTLEVISVRKAESDPAASVVAAVTAGCEPVRVITSADGSVVWVTARGSDAVLGFSAARLRADPSHALVADVEVGEAPVGLALAKSGSLIVVADSNRFSASGQAASLAVVSVPAALHGRAALVGYLPAGQFPRDMAATPGGDTVLVANFASDQLETVNIAALP